MGFLNEQYKREAMGIARDLFYGHEVVAKIREASSDAEISRILTSARKKGSDNR